MLCSARTGDGIGEVWTAIVRAHDHLQDTGELDRRRADQAVACLWTDVRDRLLGNLREQPEVAALVPDLEQAVREGRLSPAAAADRLLHARS
jgi:LAO/AO transport system kinase